MINERANHPDQEGQDAALPKTLSGNFGNQVSVSETIGSWFLGILSLTMLFLLSRSDARNRKLLETKAGAKPFWRRLGIFR